MIPGTPELVQDDTTDLNHFFLSEGRGPATGEGEGSARMNVTAQPETS